MTLHSDNLRQEYEQLRAEMQDSYSSRVEKGLTKLLSYTRRKLTTLELLYNRGLPIETTASRIVHHALTESNSHCDDAYRFASCDIDDYVRYMDAMLIRLIGNELRALYCGHSIALTLRDHHSKRVRRLEQTPCGCVNTVCCWDTFTRSELD